ncbi:MAG: DUF2341 domain-containing protein, partial [Candidatus Pacebacteria bacterium]|nr:DUF2341 domain-containing protein [Candidatus Paceibacterota bacterium]
TAQTDFQVMITLDTTTLVTANKVQSDCDDIRITDINGKLIPHWIEPTTCNTAATKIWTKVPSISTSGDTVYLYYGNSAVDSKSSTADTFIREISGVQGAWDMDEASANTCSGGVNDSCDSSGNGNDGAWQEDVAITVGKFGNGTTYDRSGDYIDCGDDASLNISNAITIEAWINTYTFSYWGGVYSKGYAFNLYNGTPKICFPGTGDCTGYGAFAFDTWQHIVVKYDSSLEENNSVIYVNGTVKATNTLTSITPSGNAKIGKSSYSYGGLIDNVRVYNTALTSTEISDLYGTGGDRQGYVTTNYPNKSLVRKYSALITIGSPASEERGPGPVAFWQFDEGFGQTANDSTINANNGTLGATSGVEASDPTWQTEDMCVSGKCLKFDGVDDYVSIDNIANDVTGDITISVWVKANNTHIAASSKKGTIISFHSSSGANKGIILSIGDGGNATKDNELNLWDGTTGAWEILTDTVIGDNTWHHIAYTLSGSTGTVYIDTVSKGTHTANWAYDSTDLWSIGQEWDNSTSSDFLDGFIDSVKIYPYARTAAQIKADYASRGTASGVSVAIGDDGKKSLFDGLVGYWKMDEASWNGTADEVVDS